MDYVRLFALALAAVLIVSGIVLILVAFLITELRKAKIARPGVRPMADAWDVLLELARRVPLIYVPGVIMVIAGTLIAAATVATAPAA